MSYISDIIDGIHDNESITENADNQALGVDHTATFLTITDTGVPTLAAGEIGQLKFITAVAVTSDKYATVTPAAVSGFATVRLDAAGEWVIFKWNGTAWIIAKSKGATINTS